MNPLRPFLPCRERSTPNGSPAMRSLPRSFARSLALVTALALGGLTTATATAADPAIPDRPEKLQYPALSYQPPKPADYRVQLRAGPVAYIVPDRTLPLVNVSVLVRTGAYLDPTNRPGVADFTGYLLVRGGVQSKTAEELDERLAFLAAGLNSAIGDESGTVSLNLLSKDLPEGLALLREALTAPRFQADKLELYREQIVQSLKQRNDDSASIHGRESEALAYGTNFWACRQLTGAQAAAITADDLRAFHRRWFHPANFTVAVSGDVDRDAILAKLEELFANWPFTGEKPGPIPTDIQMAPGGVYVVNKEVNQGRVSILLPGLKRDHPDFPAVTLMNDILGGGGFTSRIMNRVRSDEGLAYGASSAFPGGATYPRAFQAGFETKSRTVAYATRIVLDEINRISSAPVTDEEINTSKRSFVDTFPGNFSTKSRVASLFATDEFTGRFAQDPEYWQKWRGRMEAVSKDDVQRVAKEHLHADKAVILVVGQKEEIEKGHPVQLRQLASGKVTELPLRDPLTQEPLPPAKK
jgi:zinc protease